MANPAMRTSFLILSLIATSLVASSAQSQIGPPCCTEPSASSRLVPTPAPRLYIHYRDASQAAGVIALQRALAPAELNGRRLQTIVPPGEPRSTYRNTALV